VTAVDFFDESYLRWVDSLQRRQPSFGLSFVQTFGSVEISEVILGAPAVLFVTKMEISDEQVKYLRRVLERFFGASISLPTKTSWCQATVVALLWSAMQITGDDASRELGRAVARLRPSG